MPVKVIIPTPLRVYTDNKESIDIDAKTVDELLKRLSDRYAALRFNIYSEDGSLRKFVNVYVNSEDIRHLQHGKTVVTDRDVVSIIPSIAGG